MSFSWPFFPGVGPGSFLPMVFLVFGIRFQNGAKEYGPGSFRPHGFPGFGIRFQNGAKEFLGFDSKTVQRSAFCRSRRELSNAYLLAKFGFDTAENESFKVR